MTVALSCYGISASDAVEIARAAEKLGFDGMWLGEHAAIPASYRGEHPYGGGALVGERTPPADLWVTFGAVAGVTEPIPTVHNGRWASGWGTGRDSSAETRR